jgi:outer membrane receptor for ferrienterochelin and colicin
LSLAPYRAQGFLFVVDAVALLDTTGMDRTLDHLYVEGVELIAGSAGVTVYGAAAAKGVVSIVTRKHQR